MLLQKPWYIIFQISFYTQSRHHGPRLNTQHESALTGPWDDDDEAAAGGQLPDEVEMLAQSGCVWHQVGRHGGLGLGLLKAAL